MADGTKQPPTPFDHFIDQYIRFSDGDDTLRDAVEDLMFRDVLAALADCRARSTCASSIIVCDFELVHANLAIIHFASAYNEDLQHAYDGILATLPWHIPTRHQCGATERLAESIAA